MTRMTEDAGIAPDPVCDRCGAAILDTRPSVMRDGQTYCCASCARADAADIKVTQGVRGGNACSRCGAPIHARGRAVTERGRVYCCGNCAAAGATAEPEPLPE